MSFDYNANKKADMYHKYIPSLHVGKSCAHFPVDRQVVVAHPSLWYPELHEKEALVSIGYLLPTADWL